jgi:hypothetical protein
MHPTKGYQATGVGRDVKAFRRRVDNAFCVRSRAGLCTYVATGNSRYSLRWTVGAEVRLWPTVAGWLPGDSGPNAAVLVLDAPPLDIGAMIPPW